MQRRNRKKKQLRWSMIVLLMLCWFLPLMLLVFLMYYVVSDRINQQTEDTFVISTEKAIEICQISLAEAITASKNASYLPTVKESYYRYREDGHREQLYNSIGLFLAQNYKYNTDFYATMLYFVDEPDIVYHTYSNRPEYLYATVQEFERSAKAIVQETAKDLDTGIAFKNIDGHIYMIRNIVDTSFQPIAVIIMELDVDSMFSSLENIWGYVDCEVSIDGEILIASAEKLYYERKKIELSDKQSIYYHGKDGTFINRQIKEGNSMVTYVVDLDSGVVVSEINTIQYMFIVFIAFMIPLVGTVLIFFHRKVTRPISYLITASYEIENGNFGYEIAEHTQSQEFSYLYDAFNSMSFKLKNQFEKIYLEELALRDANIMALQSQINPHFLNNTLEIINWEARMTDNYKVSAMIEALSTMLEATMDRKKQPLIRLSEELMYVDAYLYIITQRYGEKFEAVKEIDESLLRVRVPRLIIQPIIENAVEYGMSIQRKGRITLSIYSRDDKMIIDVKDNGTLSDKSRRKIDMLLNKDYDDKGGKSVSLGIRNVDQRLKIIYGDDCGLTIWSNDKNETVSTLVIRKDK